MKRDPFKLPRGKVLINFSGGRTSAFMLHRILEVNGPLDPARHQVVFQNTGREFPETLDFVLECGQRWNVPIVWLEYDKADGFRIISHNSACRDGEPFEEIIRSRKYLPNPVTRFCTQELKVRPAKKYLQSLKWKRWASTLGIRADEQNRVKTEPLKEPWWRWYPLNDAGVTKQTVSEFWGEQPFNLKLLSVNGKTPHGNCDGCFLKSEANIAALTRDFPDRAAWWERMEALVRKKGQAKGDGARFRQEYSRRELRVYIENQGDWVFNANDGDGIFCQADGGECVE